VLVSVDPPEIEAFAPQEITVHAKDPATQQSVGGFLRVEGNIIPSTNTPTERFFKFPYEFHGPTKGEISAPGYIPTTFDFPVNVLASANPFLVWRGARTDQGIYYGILGSPQGRVPGVASSSGPSAIGIYRTLIFVAWKGANADPRIWYSTFDGMTWQPQTSIPNVGTSARPALAIYGGRLYVAWKGAGRDNGLWYTSCDMHSTHQPNWAPQALVPHVGSTTGPALCTYYSKLYMIWKGSHDDGLWYSSFDAAGWQPQARIPGVGTTHSPAAAVYLRAAREALFVAWKGSHDDGLWYSSFDGQGWRSQARVPGVGSTHGPTLAQYQKRLYLVWKGSHDPGIWYTSSDSLRWEPQQRYAGVGTNDSPAIVDLGLFEH
jgi:hypothetical protein